MPVFLIVLLQIIKSRHMFLSTKTELCLSFSFLCKFTQIIHIEVSIKVGKVYNIVCICVYCMLHSNLNIQNQHIIVLKEHGKWDPIISARLEFESRTSRTMLECNKFGLFGLWLSWKIGSKRARERQEDDDD